MFAKLICESNLRKCARTSALSDTVDIFAFILLLISVVQKCQQKWVDLLKIKLLNVKLNYTELDLNTYVYIE